MQPRTEWEEKERLGLLALETEEWRERRLVAENPNTSGEILERLAEMVVQQPFRGFYSEEYQMCLLTDALLVHPNTPPCSLLCLFDLFFQHGNRAFCRNPSVPFWIRDMPDFWEQLEENTCMELLLYKELPPIVAHIFIRHANDDIAQSAPLHIAIAGEVQTLLEGKVAVRASGFPKYEALHYPPFDLYYLLLKGISLEWMERLYAVLQLPLTDEPFPENTLEQWNRSPLDLLQHLAHDGNRLVRWAAQTRLEDPDFVFTWKD